MAILLSCPLLLLVNISPMPLPCSNKPAVRSADELLMASLILVNVFCDELISMTSVSALPTLMYKLPVPTIASLSEKVFDCKIWLLARRSIPM